MSTNFVLHSHRQVSAITPRASEHRELVNFWQRKNERDEQDELLQAAIKESEVCQNYRSIGSDPTGENGEECNQPGPLCLNEGCGMCQSCEAAGYLCPNAERHDFGGIDD